MRTFEPILPMNIVTKKLDQTSKISFSKFGGKSASLAKLLHLNIRIPSAFCISTDVYDSFIQQNELAAPISYILNEVDINNSGELHRASKKIKRYFQKGIIPVDILSQLKNEFKTLATHSPLCIRSSALSEDGEKFSFAGQHESFLGIKTQADFEKSIRSCWASLFESRAIFYRFKHKSNYQHTKMSILVQKLINADVSGTMFTANPMNSDTNTMLIEAVHGLGNSLADGIVSPDNIVVEKSTGKIRLSQISTQIKMSTYTNNRVKIVRTPKHKLHTSKLDHPLIEKIVSTCLEIEKEMGSPQDIEWCIKNSQLYILQSRPITGLKNTTHKRTKHMIIKQHLAKKSAMYVGKGSSKGIRVGKVRLLSSLSTKPASNADIIVASSVHMDDIPSILSANGVVTAQGGQSSHISIICRELGIPCITGIKNIHKLLKPAELITINGFTGEIFAGKVTIKQNILKLPDGISSIRDIRTKTKVYIDIHDPENAKLVARKHVDGVGHVSGSILIKEFTDHKVLSPLSSPQKSRIVEIISQICDAFSSKPVHYLLPSAPSLSTDHHHTFSHNSADQLTSNKQLLIDQAAIINAVRHNGFRNLNLILPHVKSASESKKLLSLLKSAGITKKPNLKIFQLLDTPEQIFNVSQYAALFVDGFIFDVEKLHFLISSSHQPLIPKNAKATIKALEIGVRALTRSGKNVQLRLTGSQTIPFVATVKQWGLNAITVQSQFIDKSRIILASQMPTPVSPSASKPNKKNSLIQALFQS